MHRQCIILAVNKVKTLPSKTSSFNKTLFLAHLLTFTINSKQITEQICRLSLINNNASQIRAILCQMLVGSKCLARILMELLVN